MTDEEIKKHLRNFGIKKEKYCEHRIYGAYENSISLTELDTHARVFAKEHKFKRSQVHIRSDCGGGCSLQWVEVFLEGRRLKTKKELIDEIKDFIARREKRKEEVRGYRLAEKKKKESAKLKRKKKKGSVK